MQRLASEGHDVSVFCRHLRDDVPENIRLFTGDVRDKIALRKAFSSVDIVYHLSISLDEASKEMYDINVRGTQNVVELCRERRVKQLIYLSSSGVLGETRVPAKEPFPYNPKTRYERSKAESEKIIKNSGIAYTILRTTIIMGPNLIWAQIFEAARRGYPIIGSGRNYFHLVYVDDVVNALDLVKGNGRALNQIFHIASKDVPTYESFYKMVCDELRIEMTRKHVPLAMAYFLAYLHQLKCKATGKKPKLIRMKSSIDRLVRNRIMSIEKAEKILGYAPKHTTKEAIHETIKYLKIARLGYSDYELEDIKRIKGRTEKP